MKVASIVSTRPDFIKEMLRHKYLKKMGIKEILINTGQHYEYNMSKVFFDELDIPNPDYNLNVSSGLVGKQTGEIITKVEEILINEKPDVTLVYGDVTSSLAAALASVKLKIPVVHIEGGIRTNSKFNPEDINRKICDHLADVVFAPTKASLQNLIKENVPSDKVFFFGDTTKDILLYTMKKYDIKKYNGNYLLTTIHREENVNSKMNMSNIIDALSESGEKVIFPVHPRTQKRLSEYNIINNLPSNIELIQPQSYVNFLQYLAGAKKVLTDSGTVRREAYILHKPIITLVDIIWWPETVQCGWNKVVGADKDKILDAIANFQPNGKQPELFGNGRAEEKIMSKIIEIYNKN